MTYEAMHTNWMHANAGTVAGVALGSPAFGFVEAAFGPVGLHLAVLWDLGNMLSGAYIFPASIYTSACARTLSC